MPKQQEDNAINRYIRGRILQARLDANENQGELAKALNKSRVAISDMERGKTAINASLLVQIAHHYKKPISYFYPSETIIKLSRLEEEMLDLFNKLPTDEKFKEIDQIRLKLKNIKKDT
ncbi:MAG: helix-turn-helix transcriptional regulator [Chloroflexi bacterium]|nr:helix-turn-helix transcriptional regulator [Chloroflexota bacterium]